MPQLYVVGNPSTKTDLFQNVTPCTSGANCNLGTGFTNFANGNELGLAPTEYPTVSPTRAASTNPWS